jgi:surface protein with Ig-like domain
VCASGDRLDAVLAGVNAGAQESAIAEASANSSAASAEQHADIATSTTPLPHDVLPVILINGENPATIQVGSTYADLGATITGAKADLNLGITTLLDGATTTSIQLDTTKPGEHTILYTVTDQNGLTGGAQRTVIVSAPANDNQATSSSFVSTSTPPLAPAPGAVSTSRCA